jgi:hypothetical protein
VYCVLCLTVILRRQRADPRLQGHPLFGGGGRGGPRGGQRDAREAADQERDRQIQRSTAITRQLVRILKQREDGDAAAVAVAGMASGDADNEPIQCHICTFINESASAGGRCGVCETPFPPRVVRLGLVDAPTPEELSYSDRIELLEYQQRQDKDERRRLREEQETDRVALLALRRQVNREFFNSRVEGRQPNWATTAVAASGDHTQATMAPPPDDAFPEFPGFLRRQRRDEVDEEGDDFEVRSPY